MPVDAAFWRILRQDFETLQPHKFSLIWNSSPQPGLIGKTPGESHWSWWHFPDESLRARLSALAVRGARALGYDSEDAWYDELRKSEFVQFRTMGSSRERRSDGAMVDSEFGPIHDVVKESITLCYRREADALSAKASKAASGGNSASPSWQGIRAKFLRGAAQHPDLLAHWDSQQEVWAFRDAREGKVQKPIDPESERLFKETARLAVHLLGKSHDATPSWHVWLGHMRKEKRGFERIWQMRNWRGGQDLEAYQESGVIPPDAIWTDNGNINHVFEQSADFCADLDSCEQATQVPQAPHLRSQNSPGIVKEVPTHLPELPVKFQNAFEAAKANAELEQANLVRRLPNPLLYRFNRLKLIQDVFFAYCTQARAACRAGNMTVAQVRQATETALPLICDLNFVRDHGDSSDEAKVTFRVSFMRAVADDPQWVQHLSELAALAEGASSASAVANVGNGGNPTAARADNAPPKAPDGMKPEPPADPVRKESPAAPPDMARPKRLRSTISSPIAARRMEAYLDSNPMKRTAFAVQAQTTDRTLRSFRKTGKVRRDIFENIAKAMGITPEALLKAE